MLNDNAAKTALIEGKKVLITGEGHKEIGTILEKKDKPLGSSSFLTIYKVKTSAGQIKWVSSDALKVIDTALLGEESGLGAPWPKIELPRVYQELLAEEKQSMRAYKEPAEVHLSVEDIFTMFYNAQIELRPHSIEEIKEVLKGYKEVFLYSVHTCILYKEERPFYEEYLYPKTTKILQSYGLTHILRMLLVLRRIQPNLNLTKEYTEYMGDSIKDFLHFLQTYQTELLNRPAHINSNNEQNEIPNSGYLNVDKN